MSQLLGRPNALKQVNLSAVRKAIRQLGSATRGEIVRATGISVTTVRTLLTGMLAGKEIVAAGQDASVGGRKAERYVLRKDRFFGAAFCLRAEGVAYAIADLCGEVCESGALAAGGTATEAICAFLDERMGRTEIRAIGIGVPGVVTGLSYRSKNAAGELEEHPIGEEIGARYGVPVLLENDLNAITLGFGRCYLKEFPEEHCGDVHMAYLSVEQGCISAGFLAGGRVLRGWNNYVGEIGLFPTAPGQTLDNLLAGTEDAAVYAGIVVKIIAGICCVLNPQYVAVGGRDFRKACFPAVVEGFNGALPGPMSAELLYAEDSLHDYLGGMAYLTSEQIFGSVQLVRDLP